MGGGDDGRSPSGGGPTIGGGDDGRGPSVGGPTPGLDSTDGTASSVGASIGPGVVGSASGVIRDAAVVETEPSGVAAGGAEVSAAPTEPALGASAAACRKASSM